jgi:hypothetical protein
VHPPRAAGFLIIYKVGTMREVQANKKKVIKYVVGFLGVIITICGFSLDNAESLKFTYWIIAPSYAKAMIAADKMYVRGFTLREDDIGFNEVSELIKRELYNPSGDSVPEVKITQIKTINFGLHQKVFPGPPMQVDFIQIELSIWNQEPVTGPFRDVKGKIKEAYLTNTFFQWKIIIFGTGITPHSPHQASIA